MRVALAQITSGPRPAENLELITARVREAAEQGADVVVFPEATMACFGTRLAPVAEPVDGPWARAVGKVADEHGVLVAAGMFRPSEDGRVYNTLLVTGRGEHRGYDKIHLFDAFGFAESRTVAPGAEPAVVEVDGITLGLAICYDVRFPELFRLLADRGATAMLLPASWGAGETKREQWELLVRARALDSTSWVFACGQADPAASGLTAHPTAPTGIGYSTVASPTGAITAQLDAKPGLLLSDVDTEAVTAARAAIPVLANRRL